MLLRGEEPTLRAAILKSLLSAVPSTATGPFPCVATFPCPKSLVCVVGRICKYYYFALPYSKSQRPCGKALVSHLMSALGCAQGVRVATLRCPKSHGPVGKALVADLMSALFCAQGVSVATLP